MSVSGILFSSLFSAFQPSATQNRFKQIQQDFQQLGQDLQSGNLSQAQTDFSALQQLFPGPQQGTTATTGTSTAGTQTTNPVSQAVAQLGSDLQAGNLSAAQSDFSTLQQDLQRQSAVSMHRFHRSHGTPILENLQNGQNSPATLFGQLGQQLQSGNLAAAQQTYSALQQDFLQFVGGSGTSGTTGTASISSSSLNVSA